MGVNPSLLSRTATWLADDQIRILEHNFATVSRHPDETTFMLIAAECGLTEEETQFCTKRKRAYRKDPTGCTEVADVCKC
uniref:Homeodomain-only protein n=1 Tax=Gadus morhua TaxID=8049 RepID=A0A8C4ZUM1_GADMO